ncbi:amidohydrolase [Sciscionella sediminilitoris]|uniref:amidohydrolase n=1 Tax=Sciscionella sediminilitoris TaxID=1445613 RepID=UPI0004DFC844|nr:amidohydrolase [Sciscionella sp. SE31]
MVHEVSDAVLLRGVRVGSEGPVADVRLADGRIAAIEEPGARTDGAEVLEGGTLLPGLVDGHAHLLQWAQFRHRIDLSGAASAAAAARLMAAGPHDGELLLGAGFTDGLWPDSPHKSTLDAVLGDQPAVLLSKDLHTLWCNSPALRLLGRDHPSGVFVEDECMRITAELPRPALTVTDEWVLEATEAAAARGVTAISDYEFTDTVTDWTRRLEIRSPSTRVRCVLARYLLEEAIERGHRTGTPIAELLTVGPYKLFVDGSLNTRTAYCLEPYPDTESTGELVTPPAELEPLVHRAVAAGITPALHAIGDAATRIALDAFERCGSGGRIEHAQLVAEADLARFARLGVIASVQPGHCPDDRDVAERYWAGRTALAYPYAALHRAGARLEFSSDAPVAPLDPWDAIASAVTRTDDERPPWHPEQCLPLAVALAAAAGGRTAIREGDPADLVLTSVDPAELDPHGLREIPVRATFLAGVPSYRGED